MLLHAGQFRVAHKVLLQLGINRALTAQPGKRALRLMTQFNMVEFSGARSWKFGAGRVGFLDADLDQFRSRADAGIHAARGDEFGLGLRVGRKGFEQRGEIGVREFGELAAQEAADVAFGDAALFGEVALVHVATFEATLQGDAEVAHGRENEKVRMKNDDVQAARANGWDRKDE